MTNYPFPVVNTQGTVLAHQEYRVYTSTFTSRTNLKGSLSICDKQITYQIGRGIPPGYWLPRANHDEAIPLGPGLDFDFSGPLFHLAKALAYFAITGKLTVGHMRHFRTNRMVYYADIVPHLLPAQPGLVFVEEGAFLEFPSAFIALAASVEAYQGVLASDIPSTLIKVFADSWELARGCLHAIRVLVAFYQKHNLGELAIYCVVRGFHKIFSVVAHSFEGGYFRDVLRSGDFGCPRGSIFHADWLLVNFTALADLKSNSLIELGNLIDNVLLVSGALVAIGDTGLRAAEGVRVPTYFELAGKTRAEKAGILSSRLYIVAKCWIQHVGVFFGLSSQGHAVSIVAAHIRESAQFLYDSEENRHLVPDLLAPFFWVEPTSLIPLSFPSKGPVRPLVDSAGPVVVPAFPLGAQVTEYDSAYFMLNLGIRTLRLCPGLLHFLGLPGTLGELIPDRVSALFTRAASGRLSSIHASFSEYLWQRHLLEIPLPAEFLVPAGILNLCIPVEPIFPFFSQMELIEGPAELTVCYSCTPIKSLRNILDDKKGREHRRRHSPPRVLYE